MAVNTLVVLEIFHLFFIRNIYGTSLTWRVVRGMRVVWACVVGVTGAQFAFTYAPKVFGHAQRGVPEEHPFGGEPLALRIDSRFVVRNDRLR